MQWLWASYLHLCPSVTKQHNLVPVRGRLPCDWGVQTKVWSMCVWLVKLCDTVIPLLHTGRVWLLSLLYCMTAC